jgi:hypothetical protein
VLAVEQSFALQGNGFLALVGGYVTSDAFRFVAE